jgi:glutamate-1-semialdehyde 2,1-aminomutase
MLDHGVYLPPSAFEAAFTSAAHGDAELAELETALTSAWRR